MKCRFFKDLIDSHHQIILDIQAVTERSSKSCDRWHYTFWTGETHEFSKGPGTEGMVKDDVANIPWETRSNGMLKTEESYRSLAAHICSAGARNLPLFATCRMTEHTVFSAADHAPLSSTSGSATISHPSDNPAPELAAAAAAARLCLINSSISSTFL